MATKHSLILDDTNRDGISFPYVFFFSSSLADYYDLIHQRDDVKNAIDLPRNRKKKNRSKVGREELPCWLDE
jgi:hypothetical protein